MNIQREKEQHPPQSSYGTVKSTCSKNMNDVTLDPITELSNEHAAKTRMISTLYPVTEQSNEYAEKTTSTITITEQSNGHAEKTISTSTLDYGTVKWS